MFHTADNHLWCLIQRSDFWRDSGMGSGQIIRSAVSGHQGKIREGHTFETWNYNAKSHTSSIFALLRKQSVPHWELINVWRVSRCLGEPLECMIPRTNFTPCVDTNEPTKKTKKNKKQLGHVTSSKFHAFALVCGSSNFYYHQVNVSGTWLTFCVDIYHSDSLTI